MRVRKFYAGRRHKKPRPSAPLTSGNAERRLGWPGQAHTEGTAAREVLAPGRAEWPGPGMAGPRGRARGRRAGCTHAGWAQAGGSGLVGGQAPCAPLGDRRRPLGDFRWSTTGPLGRARDTTRPPASFGRGLGGWSRWSAGHAALPGTDAGWWQGPWWPWPPKPWPGQARPGSGPRWPSWPWSAGPCSPRPAASSATRARAWCRRLPWTSSRRPWRSRNPGTRRP